MAILTIADLELRLGKTITGTSDEALYTSLISVVQSKVETILNRKLEETEYRERYDGNGQYDILLEQYPIVSITSIQNVDVDLDVLETFDSTDYVINNMEGSVYYSGGFPSGRNNIYVIYTAGYGTDSGSYALPEDLKNTMIEMIEETKNSNFTNPEMQSETLGSYSYTKKNNSGNGGNLSVSVNSQNLLILNNYMKYD